MSRPGDPAGGPADTGEPLRLASGEVHLWIARLGPTAEPGEVARFKSILSADERERLTQYRHAGARRTYLAARALVRSVLSRYAPIEPTAWQFTANAYGRPELAGPRDAPPLVFNLSHTTGMVICGVASGGQIGVDVEYVPRRWPGVRLAERYFSPSEVTDLLARPETQQRSVFFDYWTLKESYIKARGMGLALPLDQFSFRLAAGESPSISFGSGIEDDPARWEFVQPAIGPDHRVAAAVERPPRGDVRITIHEAPLP